MSCLFCFQITGVSDCIEIFDNASNQDNDNDDLDIQEETATRLIPWQLRTLLIFLFLWQFSFSISNAGIIALLYFLHRFLPLLSTRQDTLMQNIINFFPRSLNAALKLIGLDTDEFSQFTVCPKCSSVFNENDGYIINGNENVPKQCPFVKMPHHPQMSRRAPCGFYLTKPGKGKNGHIIFRPFKVYAYQSLRVAMKNLINRPGFLDLCQHWKARGFSIDQNLLGDIYDGRVWQEFMNIDGIPFLSGNHNFCFSLNVDWYQPYSRTRRFLWYCHSICWQ